MAVVLLSPPTQAGYTPFLVACEYQKEEMVRYLMEEGADIRASCRVENGGSGLTALHLAALHNAVGVADLLLGEKACPLNEQDSNVSVELLILLMVRFRGKEVHNCLFLQGNTALHLANTKYSRPVSRRIEQICSERKVDLSQVRNKVSVVMKK